jgi:hypothetical protein
MNAPLFPVGDQRSELERAEPKQRADSSSVLRSEVREPHFLVKGVIIALKRMTMRMNQLQISIRLTAENAVTG